MNKKELGKFYTTENPFNLNIFKKWFSNIPNIENEILLEPFAGSNNILNLMGVNNDWKCFDIIPTENLCPKYEIIQQDTIENFPIGYNVCITNPPYLGKNVASRYHINYQGGIYDDLYKKCLELMLKHCKYVAAIIPESFITSNLFHERLFVVISLTCKMFDDTACPVCLALFNEKESDDFLIYDLDNKIGNYNDLKKIIPNNKSKKWKFNDPCGIIGIKCVDNCKENSIKFVLGSEIKNKIQNSSRGVTKVSLIDGNIENLQLFINKCNFILNNIRLKTNDVFLTSFKQLCDDNKYRRRLDYNLAKCIMNEALEDKKVKELF